VKVLGEDQKRFENVLWKEQEPFGSGGGEGLGKGMCFEILELSM
jgi:hypothetical protein